MFILNNIFPFIAHSLLKTNCFLTKFWVIMFNCFSAADVQVFMFNSSSQVELMDQVSYSVSAGSTTLISLSNYKVNDMVKHISNYQVNNIIVKFICCHQVNNMVKFISDYQVNGLS